MFYDYNYVSEKQQKSNPTLSRQTKLNINLTIMLKQKYLVQNPSDLCLMTSLLLSLKYRNEFHQIHKLPSTQDQQK